MTTSRNTRQREVLDKALYERVLTEKDARIAELTAALEHEREQSRRYADALSKVQSVLPQSVNPIALDQGQPKSVRASPFPMWLNTASNALGGVLGTVVLSAVAIGYGIIEKRVPIILSTIGYTLYGVSFILFAWWNYKLHKVSTSGGTISVPVMAVNSGLNSLLRLGLTVWYGNIILFAGSHRWIREAIFVTHEHHWLSVLVHLFGLWPLCFFAYQGTKDLKTFIEMLQSPANGRVFFKGYIPPQ